MGQSLWTIDGKLELNFSEVMAVLLIHFNNDILSCREREKFGWNTLGHVSIYDLFPNFQKPRQTSSTSKSTLVGYRTRL